MSDSNDDVQVEQGHTSKNAHSTSRLRLRLGLFVLLGLMLFALWYDYKVARVSVTKAYDQIAELNQEMNVASQTVAMRNVDIHQLLDKKPARTFSQGPYRIEVFSWVGGLPFRTHDLYAIYLPQGNDLMFMMEYPYDLPLDELAPPTFPIDDSQADPYAMSGYPGMEGEFEYGGEYGPAPDGDDEDGVPNGRPRRPMIGPPQSMRQERALTGNRDRSGAESDPTGPPSPLSTPEELAEADRKVAIQAAESGRKSGSGDTAAEAVPDADTGQASPSRESDDEPTEDEDEAATERDASHGESQGNSAPGKPAETTDSGSKAEPSESPATSEESDDLETSSN